MKMKHRMDNGKALKIYVLVIVICFIALVVFLKVCLGSHETKADQTETTEQTEIKTESIMTEAQAEEAHLNYIVHAKIEEKKYIIPIEEIEKQIEETITAPYINTELMMLARIIENEAGANYCTDEHQRAIASVVINRVNDARFPNSIYDVILQGWYDGGPIQYSIGSVDSFFSIQPSERAINNAAYVLEYGATIPEAVWQSANIQGEVVAVFSYPDTDSYITYICR